MACCTPSSSASSRLLHWAGLLVLVCLPLVWGRVPPHLDYGVVFSRQAAASLSTKAFLLNLTLPLPRERYFHERPPPCSDPSQPQPDCPLLALASNIVQHVRAESGFHLFEQIRQTLLELGAVVGNPPVSLYNGYKFYSEDLLRRMNWTSGQIREYMAEREQTIDDYWNASLAGRVPEDQLPALLQQAMLQSVEARLEWYEYERGLRQLLQGRLHTAVVPKGYLYHELLKIFTRESSDNLRFDLEDVFVSDYYRRDSVQDVTVDQGRLIVTLSIHLASYDNMLYDLYQVKTFPVLTKAGDVLLSSRLEGVPRYLAVARDLQTYTETDELDDAACEEDEDGRTCLLNLPGIPSKNPSCLLAIFLNDTAAAKAKCSFLMQRETRVPPSAVEVSPGLVLWTNTSNITAVCEDLPSLSRVLPGCLQCLIPAPCSCILQTEHLRVTPARSRCQEGAVSPTPMPDSRAVLFRLPSERFSTSLDSEDLHAGKLPTLAGTLSEEDVAGLLSQNRLGPFPMRAAEMKTFFESLAEPKDESGAGLQALLQACLTLTYLFFGAVALLLACQCRLWQRTAALKQQYEDLKAE